MVLLTITPTTQSALYEYRRLDPCPDEGLLKDFSTVDIGGPISHSLLVDVSAFLIKNELTSSASTGNNRWRLNSLLKGSTVYQAPSPPRPKPSSEYKALMQRLRKEEEQRKYERMLDRTASTASDPSKGFNPATSHGQNIADEVDELTYADVNRQIILIINVLVSIIASGITIWFGARRWNIPERVGLSLSGSILIAVAEVAIYMGYIRRIKEAKEKEVKTIERKEIFETWIIDKSDASLVSSNGAGNVRSRKGKH